METNGLTAPSAALLPQPDTGRVPALDHFASLTAHRDREELELALFQALRVLIGPPEIIFYDLISNGGFNDLRWHERVRMTGGSVVPAPERTWGDDELLPPAEAVPLRMKCVQDGVPVQANADELHVTYFPVVAGSQDAEVVELFSASALSASTVYLVSTLLQVYLNVKGLIDYSERDELTGLLNRKTFESAFVKLSNSASRPDGHAAAGGGADLGNADKGSLPGWLGVLDVDHFKRVNDSFGHEIGDEVLLLLARIMRSTFWLKDRSFRYGGEEFAVLLRSPDEASALVGFEQLRSNVGHFRFPQVGSVTVSIGFTRVWAGDSATDAVSRADRAMYYAKQSGRNQVRSYDELARAGKLK